MLRLAVLCGILSVARSSCPPKYELVAGGECRRVLALSTFDDKAALQSSVRECAEDGAAPAAIHKEEQQYYWQMAVQKAKYDGILGLSCNSNTRHWEWLDGSPLDYRPTSSSSDLDRACRDGCVWRLNQAGTWKLECDTNNVILVPICAVTLVLPTESSGENCEGFDDDVDDGICYQASAQSVMTAAANWDDARLACQSVGAELVSIHNDQENSFIRRLAVSRGSVNGVFLGGKLNGQTMNGRTTFAVGWIDGSPTDYLNFYDNFPMDGFGQCIAMDTSTATGQWMNIECVEELPVVCQRQKTIAAEPTCKDGPLKEAGVVTSPGFPFSATISCDVFLEVDSQQKVQVQVDLEANSCCDYLTLYDGQLGGHVIANLTGEISGKTFRTTTTNIMRVSWQPRDGRNVRGYSIYFEGV